MPSREGACQSAGLPWLGKNFPGTTCRCSVTNTPIPNGSPAECSPPRTTSPNQHCPYSILLSHNSPSVIRTVLSLRQCVNKNRRSRRLVLLFLGWRCLAVVTISYSAIVGPRNPLVPRTKVAPGSVALYFGAASSCHRPRAKAAFGIPGDSAPLPMPVGAVLFTVVSNFGQGGPSSSI